MKKKIIAVASAFCLSVASLGMVDLRVSAQENVSVNVIVERLSGSNWVRVTSWTANENDAWTVGSSKNLTVGKGYYYRVRSVHYAHTDVSSSMTSSLWR